MTRPRGVFEPHPYNEGDPRSGGALWRWGLKGDASAAPWGLEVGDGAAASPYRETPPRRECWWATFWSRVKGLCVAVASLTGRRWPPPVRCNTAVSVYEGFVWLGDTPCMIGGRRLAWDLGCCVDCRGFFVVDLYVNVNKYLISP